MNENQNKTSKKTSPQNNNLRGLGLVIERADFYRDSYRSLLKLNIILSLLLAVSVLVISFLSYYAFKKEHVYFATNSKGGIIELKPLSESLMSESRIMSIVGDSATCVLTFDPVNFRSQIQKCKQGFTEVGWSNLIKKIQDAKLIEFINKDNLIVTTVRTDSPVMYRKGKDASGRLFWDIQQPVATSYRGRTSSITENQVISMRVVRVDQTEYPDGIAIESFIAEKASNTNK